MLRSSEAWTWNALDNPTGQLKGLRQHTIQPSTADGKCFTLSEVELFDLFDAVRIWGCLTELFPACECDGAVL